MESLKKITKKAMPELKMESLKEIAKKAMSELKIREKPVWAAANDEVREYLKDKGLTEVAASDDLGAIELMEYSFNGEFQGLGVRIPFEEGNFDIRCSRTLTAELTSTGNIGGVFMDLIKNNLLAFKGGLVPVVNPETEAFYVREKDANGNLVPLPGHTDHNWFSLSFIGKSVGAEAKVIDPENYKATTAKQKGGVGAE